MRRPNRAIIRVLGIVLRPIRTGGIVVIGVALLEMMRGRGYERALLQRSQT